jgi:two-component system OmpR family sensor kinase
MSIPGGIRVKLALALLGIVGGALLAAYVIVVPSLERRLVNAKLDQLQSDAEALAVNYAGLDPVNRQRLDDFVDASAFVSNARVVVFAVTDPPANQVLRSLADSSAVGGLEIEKDSTALAAAKAVQTVRARVHHEGREYSEVALTLVSTGDVMLLSSSLSDQLATVALVKRRLLFATFAALLIAVVLGFTVAAVHARRLRRLQQAADRIAEGAFGEPVVDDGNDEVGQLAGSFDRMRIQLAQLDLARKEFVANASHELRTPLFSLAGFLELLTDEELDEATRREFLATTRAQVDRLTKLATDLLDLSRMDVGRIRIEHEEVGLAEVARIVAEDLGALAEASGHAVVVEADDDTWALADEERVLQITRALAGNALVHTPRGTTVRLRAERRGERVAIVVEDDGPGIPPEHLDRIFQRFYRVEGGQASGSGLGLAIARELAGRMSGTVTVASRPGATAFSLELPAEAALLREPAPLAG